ncbi:MAG TPA: plastocyanin/azurin family copper-binding protein [Ktedonobacterales bacterium]|nr:plastocyanin/azurin family copper-binding protein [Ktedonobacterales bacterium]
MRTPTVRLQRIPLLAIASLGGFALLLAGCGQTTAVVGATNPPTATAAPTDTPAPTNTPAPTGPQAAITINASGAYGTGTYSFSPNSKSVKVGTTVTWTNNSAAPHTVTSDGGPASFDGNVGSDGGTFSFTFTKAGTYTYHCNIHPYMKASITVTA